MLEEGGEAGAASGELDVVEIKETHEADYLALQFADVALIVPTQRKVLIGQLSW